MTMTLAVQPNPQPGNGRRLPAPGAGLPAGGAASGGAFPWLVNYLNILRTRGKVVWPAQIDYSASTDPIATTLTANGAPASITAADRVPDNWVEQ